jgi:signal transduction histidine kinase
MTGIIGQTQYVDSLVDVLEKHQLAPAEQIAIYDTLRRIYSEYDIEKCLEYARKGLSLAENEKDIRASSVFCGEIGVCYYTRSSYDTAHIFLKRALDLAVRSEDKMQEMRIYMDIGNLYRRKNQYEEAIGYYLKSKNIADSIGYKKTQVSAFVNIGSVYQLLNNNEKAISSFEKAAAINETIHNPYGQMTVSYKLATIITDSAQILKYAQKAYELSVELNDRKYEIASLWLISETYSSHNETDKAAEYGDKCLQLAEAYGDQRLLRGIQNTISSLYFKQKRYSDCEKVALSVWENDSLDYVYAENAAYFLALSGIFLGKKEQAAYFLDKLNGIRNQKTDTEYHKSLVEIETRYETEKKEMRISDLERQKILFISISAAGILLAIAIWIILQQKIKNEQKKKQLIAANAILEWEKKERKRFAGDLHDGINGMLSAVKLELNTVEHLQSIRNQLDDCIETIRRMARGMMPTSLERYGMKAALEDYCRLFPNVDFHFFGENKRIDERLELVVYYCAYELVNNSFRHSGAKSIHVQLIQDGDMVSLTVHDDGCGFDKESIAQESGLKNIGDRVAAFKGKIDITTSPGKGTETNIELRTENR